MIQDRGQFEFSVFVPAPGVFAASLYGWDLNSDFGNGQSARKAPLVGQGQEFLFHFRVVTAFVNSGATTPILNLHIGLSNTGLIGGPTAMHSGSDFLSIGTCAPSEHTFGARTHMGLVAAQLQLGAEFFIRVNPWTATMGRNRAGGTVIGKDLRYMGPVTTIPNFDVGGNTGFSAGLMFGRLVAQGDVHLNPQDFIYPSATSIVG